MAIMTPRIFAVRFACPSDFVFEDGVDIRINNVPGPFGPVCFSFRTSRSADGRISVPLSVEAEGLNLDESTAIQSFADLGRIFPRVFAIASNAPVREMCLQSEFVLGETEKLRRVLDFDTAISFLRSFYECSSRTWVIRAALEYEMALRCHSEAQNTIRLAHLYQASVALGHGVIRRLCRHYHCGPSELSFNLNIEPDEVEGYVYRQIIFDGNSELFQIAYDAHARYFCLQHPEDARLWDQKQVLLQSSRSIAVAIRRFLFNLADIPPHVVCRLNSGTYAVPFF